MSIKKQHDGMYSDPRAVAVRRIGPGFFIDRRNRLYFSVRDFLDCQGHPDTPEARTRVLKTIREALEGFPFIAVRGRPLLRRLRRRKDL